MPVASSFPVVVNEVNGKIDGKIRMRGRDTENPNAFTLECREGRVKVQAQTARAQIGHGERDVGASPSQETA